LKRFADRAQAGEQLAVALERHGGTDAVVLGIPRGGVLVAAVVAQRLGLPLDIVVPRKVGAPGNPELGLGAVAPGVRVLDEDLIRRLGVAESYLERAIDAELEEIERRQRRYRGDRPPPDIAGRAAILVDDGIATGGTAVAALRWARARHPSELVLAVPVAPVQSLGRMRAEADEVVVLETPEPFLAVGEWYARFGQASDEEVTSALVRATERSV
jgi:putative phosphoribosyl transferase